MNGLSGIKPGCFALSGLGSGWLTCTFQGVVSYPRALPWADLWLPLRGGVNERQRREIRRPMDPSASHRKDSLGRTRTGSRRQLLMLIQASVLACLSGCGPIAPGHESISSRSATSDTRVDLTTSRNTSAPPPALPADPPIKQTTGSAKRDESGSIRFHDVSEISGVSFLHASGNSPEKEFPTCLGSGLALLDYDGDGWLDIYLASNRKLPLDTPDDSAGNRLYRNRGNGTFEDVTVRARLEFHGFCHGVAAADVDNDGDVDIYLTNLGSNVLYLNQGDGTFRDATVQANLQNPGWSCGAAFLDYDNDGKLDLYVSHYGEWSATAQRPYCGDAARKLRTICSPTTIPPQRHSLFHNRGDGTFEDVTAKAGVARGDGRGMGVVAADLNHDGKIDLYVANDKCPNFLFLNRGDGRFEDATETSGAAGNESGDVQGSMGVDAEDVDGDGWPEMVVTNFRGDGMAFYHNLKAGNFLDISSTAGIIPESKPYVGWGVALADFDGDGWVDLFAVNGHVDDNLPEFGQDIPYAEPARVWRHADRDRSALRFQWVADPGPFFATPHAARGAAFGDLDNDGDIDVVINHQDGHPAILLNESPPQSWVRLVLVGRQSNRSAIGAAIEAHVSGRIIHRQVKGGGSYLSANDPRVLIGLGKATSIHHVRVRWPSGAISTVNNPALGKTHRIEEPERQGARESSP